MLTLSPAQIQHRSDQLEIDDDAPRVPEVCPMDSAQARRAAREEQLQALHMVKM